MFSLTGPGARDRLTALMMVTPTSRDGRLALSELVLRFLILLPTFILLTASLSLALGAGVSHAHVLVGCVLTAGLMLADRPRQWKEILAVTLAGVALAAALVLFSLQQFDFYYDSQVYHLPSIILLRDGWNPIYHGHPCAGPTPLLDLRHCNLLYCYPKSGWIASAAVYDLTGSLEAGKFWNVWQLVALYLCAHLFFARFRNLGTLRVILFSSVIAANPVLLSELGSSYVDGQLSAQLAIFCLLLLDALLFGTSGRLLLAAASLVYLVNLKFTGFFFALVFLALLCLTGVAIGQRVRALRLGLVLAPVVFIGVLAVGFNPYVSNTLEYGNPFFPALDLKRGTSVIGNQADPEFLARNRIEKFVIATFSVSQQPQWKKPRFQAPFTSLHATPLMGNRFSGFGPLYSGALLIACGLAFFLRGRLQWCVLLTILISLLAVPTAWWARLTPQGWWLPLAVLIPVSVQAKRSGVRWVAVAALLILLFNAGLKLVAVAEHQWEVSEKRSAILNAMTSGPVSIALDSELGANSKAFYFTNKQRLLDEGIDFVEVPEPECERPLGLDGLHACPRPQAAEDPGQVQEPSI